MKVEPPKTLEDFITIKKTILELMENPYCDNSMRKSLTERLKKTEAKISELESN